MAETVNDLGEFGLIGLFRAAAPSRGWVERGIGDDCAVLDIGGGERLLVTTDMLVEGVHFRREWITPWQLGWKALAANVSDVAAMGGEPAGAFLALGLPAGFPVAEVQGLREGLQAGLAAFRLDLLGGDTVATGGPVVLCLTVLGRARRVVLRSGACRGDAVVLGGTVGDSAAGLHLLEGGGVEAGVEVREALVKAHLEPQPQVELGRLLAVRGLATAMIDVSDGLLQDLGHICAESGVGAEVDEACLPISAAASALAGAAGLDPAGWALTGGEDYRLLFTVPPGRLEEARRAAAGELGRELFPVGRIVAEPGVWVRSAAGRRRGEQAGFDHFGVKPTNRK